MRCWGRVIVHKMWIAKTNVIHERDELGLRVKEGNGLGDAIEEQFKMGKTRLRPNDFFYIDKGRAYVDQLPAFNKKTWLQAITLRENEGK